MIIILGYIDDIKLRALIVCLVTVEGEIIIFISDWQFKYDFMAVRYWLFDLRLLGGVKEIN